MQQFRRNMELDPEQRAFVDAVIAPLREDAEVVGGLENALAIAATFPTQGGDDIAAATKRMLSSGRSFRVRSRLMLVATLLMAVAASWAAVVGPPAWKSLHRVMLANGMERMMSSTCCGYRAVPSFFSKKLYKDEEDEGAIVYRKAVLAASSQEKGRILFGDLSRQDKVERWKAVWDEHPDDPAHFFAYALVHCKERSRWPDDFLETGERLDPENGWFRVVAGAAKVKAAVGIPKLKDPSRRFTREERRQARAEGRELQRPNPADEKPAKEIIDQVAWEDGIRLMREGLAMPKRDDYRRSLGRMRFGAAPPIDDLAMHDAVSISVWDRPETWSAQDWMSIPVCTEALGIAAKDAARRQDRKTLADLHELTISLGESLNEAASSLISRLITRGVVFGSSRAFAVAWADVGSPEKGKEFESVAWKLDWKSSPLPKPLADALDEHRGSGILADKFLGSKGAGSLPVTEPEIRGGRLAEYALYERFALHVAAALLFFTMIFLTCSGLRSRRRFRAVPGRLAGLLRWQDHAWILAWGVLLPLGIYVLATRLSFLSPREFALSADRFLMWILQPATLVALVILWTIQAACWRLGKRGDVLALGWPGANPGRWLALMALIGMVAGPRLLAATPDDSSIMWKMLWASLGLIAGVPWLWLIVLATGQIASAERRLHRSVLTRVMMPFVALALVLTAIPIPWIYAEEKHWVPQMDFDALKPETNMFFPRTELEYGEWIGGEVQRGLNELRLIPRD